MSCPENALRGAMTDDEFWAHVYPDREPPTPEEITDVVSIDGAPCTLCGSTGPCAYDAEGRPLIHADSQEIGE